MSPKDDGFALRLYGGVKLTLTVDVALFDGTAPNKAEKAKAVLRELRMDENVEMNRRDRQFGFQQHEQGAGQQP